MNEPGETLSKYATEIAKQFKNYESTAMKDAEASGCCWQGILIFVLSLVALTFLMLLTSVCLIQDCIKGGVSCCSALAILLMVLLLALGVFCPMCRCFKGLSSSDAAKVAEAHYRFATTYIVEMTRLYKGENRERGGNTEKCVKKDNCGNVTVSINNGDSPVG